MTTTTGAGLDLLRARMATAIGGRMAGHIERLGWGAEQLADLQRTRLRALLARAIDRSPFHAARLAGIDPARFELADLTRLPIMTKAQMMEHFDEVVTDRRVRREEVEAHIGASAAQVRQTARGADITVVADAGLDDAALTAAVEQSLRQAGVRQPHVIINHAEAIARDPRTGKARRFVPSQSSQPGRPGLVARQPTGG